MSVVHSSAGAGPSWSTRPAADGLGALWDTAVMEFHDPRGEPVAAITPYTAVATLEPGETIGLFANGFPDSVAFLEHVGDALRRTLPGVDVRLWNKGNASALASPEHLAEISDTCSAVVAAYGH